VTSIIGDGVAASACAHLLGSAGVPVSIDESRRPKVPALLIGNATQALIEDVFERKDVSRGSQRISKRVVAWGDRAETVEIPHSAVVISEQELTDRLRPAITKTATSSPDWTIHTVPRSEQLRFGTRTATASPVTLREGAATESCWIESLENGWLFLLPSVSTAWLLAVGAPPDQLLAGSRLIGEQIESLGSPTGQFPCYPRISDPLCGDNWLACGSAAMAFDPICGDGAGNAIREAILASAVIRGIAKQAKNDQKDAFLMHFRTRLIVGFLKHLELCRQFYAACSGEWWATELSHLDAGIAWCREQLGSDLKFHYLLRGFELEPV
jgi:flavin-dependent dehydrogenase